MQSSPGCRWSNTLCQGSRASKKSQGHPRGPTAAAPAPPVPGQQGSARAGKSRCPWLHRVSYTRVLLSRVTRGLHQGRAARVLRAKMVTFPFHPGYLPHLVPSPLPLALALAPLALAAAPAPPAARTPTPSPTPIHNLIPAPTPMPTPTPNPKRLDDVNANGGDDNHDKGQRHDA